jgi:hypothetical protein
MHRACCITLKEEYRLRVRWYKLATFDFTHLLLSGGRAWLDIPNALFYDGISHCFLEVECDSAFLTSCLTTALLTYCFLEVECDSTFLTYHLTSVERDSTKFTSFFKTVGRDSTSLTLCLRRLTVTRHSSHTALCRMGVSQFSSLIFLW